MTLFYLLFAWLVLLALCALAVVAALRLYQHVTRYQRLKAAQPQARLALVPVFVWVAVLLTALAFIGRANVWLPRANPAAPAVNATIGRHNQERLNPNARPQIQQAEPVNTNAARAAARAQQAQETKDGFGTLPDSP